MLDCFKDTLLAFDTWFSCFFSEQGESHQILKTPMPSLEYQQVFSSALPDIRQFLRGHISKTALANKWKTKGYFHNIQDGSIYLERNTAKMAIRKSRNTHPSCRYNLKNHKKDMEKIQALIEAGEDVSSRLDFQKRVFNHLSLLKL